jgi:hypothetical protein
MALTLSSASQDPTGPTLDVSSIHVGKTEDSDPRASF